MRREYVGGAQAARLTVALGGATTNLTITCNDLTNWPTGANSRPFYVVIDRNTASEEKILCTSRSANVITVYDDGVLNGRGADGTQVTSHSSNSIIEHVFTATDADEANEIVSLLSDTGSNGNVLVKDSTSTANIKWEDISSAQGTINPFLLMGA